MFIRKKKKMINLSKIISSVIITIFGVICCGWFKIREKSCCTCSFPFDKIIKANVNYSQSEGGYSSPDGNIGGRSVGGGSVGGGSVC